MITNSKYLYIKKPARDESRDFSLIEQRFSSLEEFKFSSQTAGHRHTYHSKRPLNWQLWAAWRNELFFIFFSAWRRIWPDISFRRLINEYCLVFFGGWQPQSSNWEGSKSSFWYLGLYSKREKGHLKLIVSHQWCPQYTYTKYNQYLLLSNF